MKKVSTVLLLAVFVLAQFSMASAAAVAGDASITSLQSFTDWNNVDVEWAVSGMAAGTKNVLLWAREYPAAAYVAADCQPIAAINGTSDANGTFGYDFTTSTLALANGDQVEFAITVDGNTCATADLPAADSVMGTTYIDSQSPTVLRQGPPSLSGLAPDQQPVACNTFEYWALASDKYGFLPGTPYSGFSEWHPQVTGTFAAPAPIGPDTSELSWVSTLPATASGNWSYSIQPDDMAGNQWGVQLYFRNTLAIDPAELVDCETFSDVSGHEDEVYVRYLATLGLISGFADGTFGPDNTLTRAEASTLIEISKGYDETTLPTAAPAGCDFTDVSASDWFAGWVWQACADGYMNGVGGGLFDPNNLLTRGQIVTILNNVYETGATGGYLNTSNTIAILGSPVVREAAWTDVSVGAYYATPVIRTYGLGIADGTSATTFSPDQAATRGEFAKMLYRALSR